MAHKRGSRPGDDTVLVVAVDAGRLAIDGAGEPTAHRGRRSRRADSLAVRIAAHRATILQVDPSALAEPAVRDLLHDWATNPSTAGTIRVIRVDDVSLELARRYQRVLLRLLCTLVEDFTRADVSGQTEAPALPASRPRTARHPPVGSSGGASSSP